MVGGHHTRLRDQEINFCVYGVPPPPYIKGGGGEGRPRGWRALGGGNLLQVGLPLPFLVQEGAGRKERERGKARGRRPPFLVLFGLKGRGRASCPCRPLSLSTRAQQGPLVPAGGSGNPRYSDKCLKPSGTFMVSKHSRPIYRSLRLDHFENPRHVMITSGTPNYLRYIKTYKLII